MKIKFISGIAILVLPAAAFATEYQAVERPRQVCWNEQIQVQPRGGDYGGAIVGGIAGGLLGNQVGRGNGRTVATAVGAMTGAMVGDRMTSSNGPYFETVQRCRTVVDRVQVPVYEESPEIVVVQQPPRYMEQRGYYYERRDERDYGGRGYWDQGWHGKNHGHEHDWEHRWHDEEHEREHHGD